MEEFLIRLAFVATIAILFRFSWRVDAVRSTAQQMARSGRQFVRAWRRGHATTTMRIKRDSERRGGWSRWHRP
jgi:hypothetical protein